MVASSVDQINRPNHFCLTPSNPSSTISSEGNKQSRSVGEFPTNHQLLDSSVAVPSIDTFLPTSYVKVYGSNSQDKSTTGPSFRTSMAVACTSNLQRRERWSYCNQPDIST